MIRHEAERLDDLSLIVRMGVVGHAARILQSAHGKSITYKEIAEKAGVSKQVAKDAVKVIVEACKNLIAEEKEEE